MAKKTMLTWVLIGMVTMTIPACTQEVGTNSPAGEAQRTQEPGKSNGGVKDYIYETQRAFVEIANKSTDSVVNVSTVRTVTGGPPGVPFDDEFFRRFFDIPEREYKQRGLGSGVIVSKDGYILTNYHVIRDAQEIVVWTTEQKDYTAKVIGTDPKTDIAVLKIDAQNLNPIEIGNSDDLDVGQWAIAIGAPFGLTKTVTVGIVSAKGRSNLGVVEYEDFIQTDAAINPGNSGGALLNIDGKLVGINTAIFSQSGGYQGIGFAIPVNIAMSVMKDIIKQGRVIRGWLGVGIQPINEALAEQLKLETVQGVLITQVMEGSPAAKAGLQRGDVVVSYRGDPVEDPTQFRNRVAQTAPGTKVPLTVVRNGKKVTLNATIGEQKDEPVSEPASFNNLGFRAQNLTRELANELGLRSTEGVIVTEVKPGTEAERVGLQPGDVILEVNRKEIKTMKDFSQATGKLKKGERALLLVRRGQNESYVVVEAQ